MVAPNAIGVLVGGLIAGRLIFRAGARVIALVGVALATLTYALLAMTTPTVAALALEPIPLGIGTGMAVGAIFNLTALAFPVSLTASTMSLSTTVRLVCAALGAQVAVAVVTAAPVAFPALKRLATHLVRAGVTGPRVRLLVAEGPDSRTQRLYERVLDGCSGDDRRAADDRADPVPPKRSNRDGGTRPATMMTALVGQPSRR